ncbi:MAG: hypothetical protein ABSG41_10140 [Bryobacteraceae bacterium]|jgi:hypothetical protein
MELNPAHIVIVTDLSAETLRSIIAHLEVSTDFEHLVYRESELDAIWSIAGFLLNRESDSTRRDKVPHDKVLHIRSVAHRAHDLVAARLPRDAAALLRELL